MDYKKKLIEVALPLEAINIACAREKSIRHGHPSTLHLWWARRPLAAARAVIFAQMVDDPSSHPEIFPTVKTQEKERKRLFDIIERLVQWENTTNESVLQEARDEIWASWRKTCTENISHPRAKELYDRHNLPAFHDPFAGGGALPLEAQRLGLESFASDLNPVAVLINKAMIEIPPRFAGKPPVNPEARGDEALFDRPWQGGQGLAEDVLYYGKWMRAEAEKRIGGLYPKIQITKEMVSDRPDLKEYLGDDLTVIAWIWARTVESPNPAYRGIQVPLASTFVLSSKTGREAYIEPRIEDGRYSFTVKLGKSKNAATTKSGTKLSRGANFRCIMSDTPIASEYIYSEAMNGRLGQRLMAVVAEGRHGRVYLAPTAEMEDVSSSILPNWKPELAMPDNPRWFSPPLYGLKTYGDLFTPRQLVAITTLCDLIGEARAEVKRDALKAGFRDDESALEDGGKEALAYAEAVGMYLAFALDKGCNYWSSLCAWSTSTEKMVSTFGRQALPMVWDYTEANPFSDSSGNWDLGVEQASKMLRGLGFWGQGTVRQADAQHQMFSLDKVVSTDPPYYDNIGYADLSDYFYVWLRRSQRSTFPNLFSTLAVPKAEELVATPYRHGGKEKAEHFFLDGMTEAMRHLGQETHPSFPVTIYYAFKQSESKGDGGNASTGWETFLDAVMKAGLKVNGTWPMHTEYTGNLKNNISALASSIVLVCRSREVDAPSISRGEFMAALKLELPTALAYLQKSNIAPVDLAQAAIGPGMSIFTRYSQVLDAEGKPLAVRDALAIINQALDEVLAEQENDFDGDSRWALAWFEQYGFVEGEFGMAEQLSKSKNTSVAGMAEANILESKRGKVRLLKPEELPEDWNPVDDKRLTAWEAVHQSVRALSTGGESAAAGIVNKLGPVRSEIARELAYRLYTVCERKKRTAEALSYNGLVQSWPAIVALANKIPVPNRSTEDMFDQKA